MNRVILLSVHTFLISSQQYKVVDTRREQLVNRNGLVLCGVNSDVENTVVMVDHTAWLSIKLPSTDL